MAFTNPLLLFNLPPSSVLLNTTVNPQYLPNERSLYALPDSSPGSTRVAMQLIRAGTGQSDSMLASWCNVPSVGGFWLDGSVPELFLSSLQSWVPPLPPASSPYRYSCRPGTGITLLNSFQGACID